MRLHKLIKKLANYNKVDILGMSGERLYPVCEVREFIKNYNIEDIKKYKVLQIHTYTQEPGIITIYVEKVR